jgi:hypothetical protein
MSLLRWMEHNPILTVVLMVVILGFFTELLRRR